MCSNLIFNLQNLVLKRRYKICNAIKKDKETTNVKVMVGGTPLTQGYAHSIGAAGYAPDASGAVDLANNLFEGNFSS